MIFEEKYFSRHILLTGDILLSDCLHVLRYLAICTCFCFSLWHHKFSNLPLLSYQVVFLYNQKRQGKNVNILRMKRDYKMKWKALSITFQELSLKQVKPNILEGEGLNLNLYYFKSIPLHQFQFPDVTHNHIKTKRLVNNWQFSEYFSISGRSQR